MERPAASQMRSSRGRLSEPRAQLHQVQVVQLHQPAPQQLLVGAELRRHFARRAAVGEQVEAA